MTQYSIKSSWKNAYNLSYFTQLKISLITAFFISVFFEWLHVTSKDFGLGGLAPFNQIIMETLKMAGIAYAGYVVTTLVMYTLFMKVRPRLIPLWGVVGLIGAAVQEFFIRGMPNLFNSTGMSLIEVITIGTSLSLINSIAFLLLSTLLAIVVSHFVNPNNLSHQKTAT